ncbi:hypothetical protein CRENBAI_006110 [Crenichthys baileyi]|uniref:Uncharacterized protein n=1 Tax=Crenichthys baileyi TaxID=28760 RepID=A0AAV9S1F4_9TELE
MVDSHCSSSMKFPDFSASRTLLSSACKVDPANISSGTRRHTISDISTMFNRRGGENTHTGHLLARSNTVCRLSSSERRRMLRLDGKLHLISLKDAPSDGREADGVMVESESPLRLP